MKVHPSTKFDVDDIRSAGARCWAPGCYFGLLPSRDSEAYKLDHRGQLELIVVDKLVARPYAIEEDVARESL